VPKGTKAVYLLCQIGNTANTTANPYAILMLRKNGSSKTASTTAELFQNRNPGINGTVYEYRSCVTVDVDENGIFEYIIAPNGSSAYSAYITVIGYYL